MNEDLTGTPQFPHNWMYDGKQVKQSGDFTLEITCKALLLIFKDSGELDAGRADIFVDGAKKLTADPHINGWVHCNPVIVLQEKEPAGTGSAFGWQRAMRRKIYDPWIRLCLLSSLRTCRCHAMPYSFHAILLVL